MPATSRSLAVSARLFIRSSTVTSVSKGRLCAPGMWPARGIEPGSEPSKNFGARESTIATQAVPRFAITKSRSATSSGCGFAVIFLGLRWTADVGSPVDEARRVEAEVNARGRRDPVLAEVDDDARVVADSEALELCAELVGRKKLEDERALGPRDREVLRVHEQRAGDVLLLEVGRHAHVQEDEVLFAPMLDEPVGRHEHVRRGLDRRGREEDKAGEYVLHGTSGSGIFCDGNRARRGVRGSNRVMILLGLKVS